MNRELLDIYSDYLIGQNQYATATGLAALLDGEVSHDQVSRFYVKKIMDQKSDVRTPEQSSDEVLLLDEWSQNDTSFLV